MITLICPVFTMVRPWREARPPRQTICSHPRSRTLEWHSLFSGCLINCVYATALCQAMDSANGCLCDIRYESSATRLIWGSDNSVPNSGECPQV